MNIINKIKAFFIHQNEPVELDLVAAEIRDGRAYLHPKGGDGVTYLVKSDDIEITLNRGRSLGSKHIYKTSPRQNKKEEKVEAKIESRKTENEKPKKDIVRKITEQTAPNEFDKFKKICDLFVPRRV